MSGKPVNETSSKAQPQPVPNLNNLSRLSESSTGDWERGKPSGNARSPKATTSVLEQAGAQLDKLSIGDKPPQAAAARAAHVQTGFVPDAEKRSQSPLHPRLQREGYGFRPASGASTPTGSHANPLSPSVGAQSTDDKELEDEELNAQLNDEVRNALKEPVSTLATTSASTELLPPGGIADANGLGWPGMLNSDILR